MRLLKFVTISMFLVFFLLACAAKKTSTTPVVPATEPIKEGSPLREGWEGKWENTLRAAQREGKVSVYASLLGPQIRMYAPSFKKKFGVELEVTTGRGAEVREKILREKAAGIYIADVAVAGLNTLFEIKKAGATEPMSSALIFPEITDSKMWYTGDAHPWGDEAKHIFAFIASPNRDIIVNADLVKPGEIKSWHDLLDPKWRGKIIWNDPTITGSGFNGFSTMLVNKVLDLDFYRQMVATQQIQLTRDLRLQVDWLARGRFHIAISAESTPVAEFRKAGANLDLVAVKEGTYVSSSGGNIAIVSKSPNPDAAMVFINWLLSKEGQTFISNEMLRQSAREDIPTGNLDPLQVRKTGEKYFIAANSIEKWIYEEQDKYTQMSREIFGPLLR